MDKILRKIIPHRFEVNLGFVRFLWGNSRRPKGQGNVKAGGYIKCRNISATGDIEAGKYIDAKEDIMSGK